MLSTPFRSLNILNSNRFISFSKFCRQKSSLSFETLGINSSISHWIKNSKQWICPTSIQRLSIAPALQGANVVATSHTGTGKTGAYILPFLQQYSEGLGICKKLSYDSSLALILTPSSELAKQVYHEAKELSQCIQGFNPALIISDHEKMDQIKLLQKNPQLIIATPGRLLQLLLISKEKKYDINLSNVRYFVVDECDKLLSCGFYPDVKEIWSFLPRPSSGVKMQTLVFTATLVPEVEDLVKRLAPKHTIIDLNPTNTVPKNIVQVLYEVSTRRKLSLLLYFLKRKGKINLKQGKTLVFCRTQQRCERISEKISNCGITSGFLHSECTTGQKKMVMSDFKNGDIQVLVATDIAARGMDIADLSNVVNFDLPHSPPEYVHRVGRTGRSGKPGLAISFCGREKEVLRLSEHTVVERCELKYRDKIVEFLKSPLQKDTASPLQICSKVPGPWKDQAISEENEMHTRDNNSRNLEVYHPAAKDLLRKNKKMGRKLSVEDSSSVFMKYDLLHAKKKGIDMSKSLEDGAKHGLRRWVKPLKKH